MQDLISILIDLLLLSFFSVGHTLLLNSIWRKRIAKIVPSQLFFTIYSLHSAISLMAMFIFWHKLPGVFWSFDHGPFKWLIELLMMGSWLYMGYALYSTGAMKHIGVAQWIDYHKGRVTHYELIHSGAYNQCRHPIFLAFFGMIWATPYMTSGHMLVTIYWSIYLVLGTIWKEDQLYRNATYREYAQEIPPYPFLAKKTFREILGIKMKQFKTTEVLK